MGAGGAAAVIAAAAAKRAEQRIVDILRAAEATSAAKAAPLHPKRMIDQSILKRLIRGGAVIDAGGEKYWLSEPGYAAYQDQRRKTAVIALIFALGLTIVLIAATVGFVQLKG